MIRRIARAAAFALLALLVVALGAWATLAIRFSNLPGEGVRIGAAGLFAIGFAAAFLLLPRRRRTLLVFAVAWCAVLAWWLAIPARNDRGWRSELARAATASFDGDRVTIHDLRDVDWKNAQSGEVRWRERTVDLGALRSVDFVMSQWDGLTEIAHSMFSFGFADGEHVVISMETRLEVGEPQTGLRGLFKQYERITVVGTERDLLRVRTCLRGEDLRVYPVKAAPEEVRAFFVAALRGANELAAHPGFYNTITDNCTTGWLPLLRAIGRKRRFDVRLLLNGHSDELAWERGAIRNDLPLTELRRIHHVNQYVRADSDADDFSRLIRPWETGVDAR